MRFRSRLLVAFGAIVLVPLAVMALGVQREMTSRLTAQYDRRVTSLVDRIARRIAADGEAIAVRLAALRETIRQDNRLRTALSGGPSADRTYLLDYAEAAMRLTGLSMLQVQDGSGRILSSGHFRNEYDLLEPQLPRHVTALAGQAAIVDARTPEGPFPALVRIDSLFVGGRRLTVIGGIRIDPEFLRRLAGGEDVGIALVYHGGAVASDAIAQRQFDSVLDPTDSLDASWASVRDSLARSAIVREVPLAQIQPERVATLSGASGGGPSDSSAAQARIVVSYPLDELTALRRELDRWFLTVILVTTAVALVVTYWLATRLSRPIRDLAAKTSVLDLDRLSVDFTTNRNDEIGDLARLLGAMTARLRASAVTLREIERRAAMGDLARQVNHDIKNGLIPIRNIVRHLEEVATQDPGQFATVFEERRHTLVSSIAYLESLATKYARLSPTLDKDRCDLNAVVTAVVRDVTGDSALVRTALAPDLLPVAADPVALRRIVENVVGNALDSLDDSGTVTVMTESVETQPLVVRLTVRDTGKGMTADQLDRAFDDFYTTKATGTGLGLSIVRRLVMDLDGSLRVESQPGSGTAVVIELPVAGSRVAAQEVSP